MIRWGCFRSLVKITSGDGYNNHSVRGSAQNNKMSGKITARLKVRHQSGVSMFIKIDYFSEHVYHMVDNG